jgi:UDP-N-acetylmuramyl pentapeptide synthase
LVVQDSLEALQSLARDWRRRFPSPVIGVTGSVGKTTVKEMLGAVFGSLWFRTRGNYNNHIGVPLSLLELDPRCHGGAILEAGINDVGEMFLLADLIMPDMVIITAVEPAHLERLGDLDGVAREKAILAKAVKPGGEVYIPVSLLKYKAFREIPSSIRVHALAINGESVDPGWSSLENVTIYHYNWKETGKHRGRGELASSPPMTPGSFPLRAGSPGMVRNLALVVHVALILGVPEHTIRARLEAWRPYRKRGELMRKGRTLFYIDCYNANPGSMLDSSQRFSTLFPEQAHLYVLGSMNELGADSAFWHRETARQLTIKDGAPLYLIGDEAESLAEGLKEQGIEEDRIKLIDDREFLQEKIASFEGAVFIKGSRSLGLENLLPEGGQPC